MYHCAQCAARAPEPVADALEVVAEVVFIELELVVMVVFVELEATEVDVVVEVEDVEGHIPNQTKSSSALQLTGCPTSSSETPNSFVPSPYTIFV
jgi:hypothetical protein